MRATRELSSDFKAHQLISISQGKFVLNEPAASIIRDIKSDLGVITVAGAYRTGKSYILNRFLGRQTGFVVGPTVNTCTKGIYIWGGPIVVERSNKKPLNVILVDTEGISSLEKDETYDTKIFSVAIFISSYLIYNSMNVIDEHSLDSISFFAELSDQLCSKNEELDQSHFPRFLWLLRDFTLQLVDKENRPMTATQYLENALVERATNNPAKITKNEIRSSIKRIFSKRDCFTLPRPVMNERDLQCIDSVAESSLRPEFLDACKKLVDMVFSQVEPKVLKSKPLDGSRFMDLLEIFLGEINKGSIPTMKSSWESLMVVNNRNALEQSKKRFESTIEEHFGSNVVLSDTALKELRITSMESCLEAFNDLCYGDNTELRKVFIEYIKDRFAWISRENRYRSADCAKTLIVQYFGEFEGMVMKGEIGTVRRMMEVWRLKVMKPYFNSLTDQASEKVVYQVFIEFTSERFNEFVVNCCEKWEKELVDGAKEKEREISARVLELEKELRVANAECEGERRVNIEYQARVLELKEMLDQLRVIIKRYEEEKLEMEKELIEMKGSRESGECRINALEGEKDELLRKVARYELEIGELSKEFEEYKRKHEDELLIPMYDKWDGGFASEKKDSKAEEKEMNFSSSSSSSSSILTSYEGYVANAVENVGGEKDDDLLQKSARNNVLKGHGGVAKRKRSVAVKRTASRPRGRLIEEAKDLPRSVNKKRAISQRDEETGKFETKRLKEDAMTQVTSMSIRDLQRVLLEADIALPTTRQPKAVYIKLYNDNLSKILKNRNG